MGNRARNAILASKEMSQPLSAVFFLDAKFKIKVFSLIFVI